MGPACTLYPDPIIWRRQSVTLRGTCDRESNETKEVATVSMYPTLLLCMPSKDRAISSLAPHCLPSPPPFQIRANFAKNPGGPPPSSEMCLKKFSRGTLTIRCTFLRRGGGPFTNVQKWPALHFFSFFLQDEGPTTLVTWVPQNRQGKLHPSLRGCSAPPPFKWGS